MKSNGSFVFMTPPDSAPYVRPYQPSQEGNLETYCGILETDAEKMIDNSCLSVYSMSYENIHCNELVYRRTANNLLQPTVARAVFSSIVAEFMSLAFVRLLASVRAGHGG